jgi:hypothetical protein
MVGKRNATNSLWNIPLAPKTTTQPSMPEPPVTAANGAIQNVNTKQDLAAFLHACAFSPQPSTFLQAMPSVITRTLSSACILTMASPSLPATTVDTQTKIDLLLSDLEMILVPLRTYTMFLLSLMIFKNLPCVQQF